MYFWILLSLLYLGAAGYAPFWFGAVPESAFEWGVYATGFVMPLAFFWFLLVALLQRRELQQQRQSMDAQHEELRGVRAALDGNAATQMKAAEMTLEAARLARSTAFVNSVSIYQARLAKIVQEIGKRLPSVAQPESGQVAVPLPRDFQTLVDYLALIESNKVDVTKHLGVHTQDVMRLVKEYQTAYGTILTAATETNNVLLVSGSMAEVNDRLVRQFGTQS